MHTGFTLYKSVLKKIPFYIIKLTTWRFRCIPYPSIYKKPQMKKYSKTLLAVLLSVASVAGYSQVKDARPKLYAARPQSINIDKNIFASVLDVTEGKEVSVPLSGDFTFTGKVIGNFTKYNNMHTVMVRSNENLTTILQITAVQNDNSISFTGRIINSNAADGYEIKNNNGIYTLQKFETLKILDPCKL